MRSLLESNSIERTFLDRPRHCLHLLYHELRKESSRYSYVTDVAEFEKHADLFAQIQAGGTSYVRPEITFDDGHISNYEFAFPVLQSRGLTAHFFITAGWTGQRQEYMGWTELRSLHDAGQMIGAHGWTHTLLTHCNDMQLKQELEGARLSLEDHLGAAISTMSLPGGRSNQHVLAACFAAGYKQIYTSIPRVETLPLGTIVGRFNILQGMDTHGLSSLLERDGKALARSERSYRVKEAAKALLGDRIYERIWAALNHQDAQSNGGEAVDG
jgi:peptidoglycan/xylan/chitin deacetylase (PgdA/CDA1 family)